MRYIFAFVLGVIGTFAFAFFTAANKEYWIFLAQNFYDYSYRISAWILGSSLVVLFYFVCSLIFDILKEGGIKEAKERADEIIRIAEIKAKEMREQAETELNEAENKRSEIEFAAEQYKHKLTEELQEKLKSVEEKEKELNRTKYAYKTEIDSLVYKNKILKEALKNRYQKYLDINPNKRRLREIRKAYSNMENFNDS